MARIYIYIYLIYIYIYVHVESCPSQELAIIAVVLKTLSIQVIIVIQLLLDGGSPPCTLNL